MTRSTWSSSPSPSSSSGSSSTSSNSKSSTVLSQEQIEKISAKCLVEIPLVPPPSINYKNLTALENAEFVNVVYESDANNSAFFRISDEQNQEICRILPFCQVEQQPEKKGVKFLEFHDMLGNIILYVAYPIGLGEVALLSPTEELVGECMSNVEFICLSVKVKYNFFDTNGKRLMKLTAIMPEEGSRDKFVLMVKRSKKEKLALIKMGSLKSCCHIKFKTGLISLLERIQIIALWAGFMHNEIQDTEASELLEKQAQAKKNKTESRRKKSFAPGNATVMNGDDGDRNNSKIINENNLDAKGTIPPVYDSDVMQRSSSSSESDSNKVIDKTDENNTIAKVKLWKNLVTSHLSRRNREDRNRQNKYVGNNNNTDLGDKELQYYTANRTTVS